MYKIYKYIYAVPLERVYMQFLWGAPTSRWEAVEVIV